jgi:hypothetical protein
MIVPRENVPWRPIEMHTNRGAGRPDRPDSCDPNPWMRIVHSGAIFDYSIKGQAWRAAARSAS